jgi:tRNA(Ile)-lysidine synthetase-like protein
MHVDIEPGAYVVAVSGGVDSMVLLHALHEQYANSKAEYQFFVAHYDHGIRADSAVDATLVENTAKSLGLPFFSEQGHLGEHASEALARAKRYDFLRRIQAQVNAGALLTAHHQDDVLETAILNLIRGTGRKGLTSLSSGEGLIRPLLHVSKQDILVHAKRSGIAWREDSTNQDMSYLRNKIRHTVLAKFTAHDRRKLLGIIADQRVVNARIDTCIAGLLPLNELSVARRIVVQAPYVVATELVASWLREQDIEFDQKAIHRVVVGCKTLQAGRCIDISSGYTVCVGKETLSLVQTGNSGKTLGKSV